MWLTSFPQQTVYSLDAEYRVQGGVGSYRPAVKQEEIRFRGCFEHEARQNREILKWKIYQEP